MRITLLALMVLHVLIGCDNNANNSLINDRSKILNKTQNSTGSTSYENTDLPYKDELSRALVAVGISNSPSLSSNNDNAKVPVDMPNSDETDAYYDSLTYDLCTERYILKDGLYAQVNDCQANVIKIGSDCAPANELLARYVAFANSLSQRNYANGIAVGKLAAINQPIYQTYRRYSVSFAKLRGQCPPNTSDVEDIPPKELPQRIQGVIEILYKLDGKVLNSTSSAGQFEVFICNKGDLPGPKCDFIKGPEHSGEPAQFIKYEANPSQLIFLVFKSSGKYKVVSVTPREFIALHEFKPGPVIVELARLVKNDACDGTPNGGFESRIRFKYQKEKNICPSEVQNRQCINGVFTSWSGGYLYDYCVVSN